MLIIRIILIIVWLLIFPPWKGQRVRAGWGPQNGAPVGVPVQVTFRWAAVPDAPDQLALYLGTVQVGSWNYKSEYYREYNARTGAWGRYCEPPVAPPSRAEQLPSPTVFGEIPPGCRMVVGPDGKPAIDCGLKPDQMSKSEVFWHGDRKVTRTEHDRLLGDPAVPEDASKPHVVVVCADKPRREAMRDALEHSPVVSQKAQLHVYDPGDMSNWALEVLKLDHDKRFKESNFLTLLQKPKNKDTGLSDSMKAWYSGSPEEITLAVDRVINEHYKPDKVPDGNAKPLPENGKRYAPLGIIAAGAGALVYFSRRQRSNV